MSAMGNCILKTFGTTAIAALLVATTLTAAGQNRSTNYSNGERAKSQVSPPESTYNKEDDAFFIVEEMPKFSGGLDSLMSHIAQNFQYPKEAIEKRIEGKVFVTFIVNVDGEVENVRIARGVDPILDEEAVRVVKTIPKWEKPGMHKGKKVRVSYTLPINFKL